MKQLVLKAEFCWSLTANYIDIFLKKSDCSDSHFTEFQVFSG